MNWQVFFQGIQHQPETGEPLYAQIAGILRHGIQSGQLADNCKLPTNRELSSLLRIDRSTVARAYLELEKDGFVHSHVGRGTFVVPSLTRDRRDDAAGILQALSWQEKFSRASQITSDMVNRQALQSYVSEGVISFAGGVPTEEFYPYEEFEGILREILAERRGDDLFGYSPVDGHPSLRAAVLNHLTTQGIVATDQELLIVSGSQQGIDIVTYSLIDPNDLVLFEEPTYIWAMCNFKASQARCLPIPLDDSGIEIDVLEAVLSRQRAKLLYLIPTFQNPTGRSLSLQRRKRLLDLARRHQLPILEDNFVGDLRYEGEPLPSLRALDGSGMTVIHQGTFSKTLCPGLRLGWIVAPPEVMARLRMAKRARDLTTTSITQVIMAEYLRKGLYERHISHVSAIYKARRDVMCRALKRAVNPAVTWNRPEGGLFIWMKLPNGCSSRELLPYAERHGVSFSCGDMFFANGDRPEFLRLSFIQSNEETIERGVVRLGKAIDQYLGARARLGTLSASLGRTNESAMV